MEMKKIVEKVKGERLEGFREFSTGWETENLQ